MLSFHSSLPLPAGPGHGAEDLLRRVWFGHGGDGTERDVVTSARDDDLDLLAGTFVVDGGLPPDISSW